MSDRDQTAQKSPPAEPATPPSDPVGHGTVPNVSSDPAKKDIEELYHNIEETKGDWGKDR